MKTDLFSRRLIQPKLSLYRHRMITPVVNNGRKTTLCFMLNKPYFYPKSSPTCTFSTGI